jgi:hypothetical protein
MRRRPIEEHEKLPVELEEKDFQESSDDHSETEDATAVQLPGVDETIEPISARKGLAPWDDLEMVEEAVRIVAEQLRLTSLNGGSQRSSGLFPSDRAAVSYRGHAGANLCPNCLHTFPHETDYSCSVCDGAICPDCAVVLPVTDRVVCSTCLTAISEEA